MTGAPYGRMSFSEYLTECGIHPWLSDIAANAISLGTSVDVSVERRISAAFSEFAGGDPGIGCLADIVSMQGYSVSEMTENGFTVTGKSIVWHIRSDGPGYISAERDGGTRRLPIYTIGMFVCLDPERRPEFRQKRIEYHWPDPSIPGR